MRHIILGILILIVNYIRHIMLEIQIPLIRSNIISDISKFDEIF